MIASGHRQDYGAAAKILKKVRDPYARLGETAAWERYIEEVRVRERRVRNLMRALDAAGM